VNTPEMLANSLVMLVNIVGCLNNEDCQKMMDSLANMSVRWESTSVKMVNSLVMLANNLVTLANNLVTLANN